MENMKEVLTVREVAELLRISMPSAYALTDQPGFPVVRVGRKKLIPAVALSRWLEKAGRIDG